MKIIRNKEDEMQISVEDIERLLGYALTPITPNQEFVINLRGKLEKVDSSSRSVQDIHYILLIATGIFSTVALFIMGVRSVMVMLGTMGLLTHYRQTLKNRKINNFTQC